MSRSGLLLFCRPVLIYNRFPLPISYWPKSFGNAFDTGAKCSTLDICGSGNATRWRLSHPYTVLQLITIKLLKAIKQRIFHDFIREEITNLNVVISWITIVRCGTMNFSGILANPTPSWKAFPDISAGMKLCISERESYIFHKIWVKIFGGGGGGI